VLTTRCSVDLKRPFVHLRCSNAASASATHPIQAELVAQLVLSKDMVRHADLPLFATGARAHVLQPR
jgi:hypothetical protein